MGIIKQGILGGVSGKVGSVVGTSWKGRAVLKSLPQSVANPNTEGQAAQRTSFKSIAQVGSLVLTSVVQKMYNPISGNITGYNKFCSQNKSAFNSLGVLVPANLRLGGGNLPLSEYLVAGSVSGDKSFAVTFTNPATLSPIRLNDSCCFLGICEETGDVFASTGLNARSIEETQMYLMSSGSDLTGALHVQVCQGFISSDGRSVSVVSTPIRLTLTFS